MKILYVGRGCTVLIHVEIICINKILIKYTDTGKIYVIYKYLYNISITINFLHVIIMISIL
jgi:hypothetical protein